MADPTDIFPPRDLPGRADDWGRKAEDGIKAAQRAAQLAQQSVGNLARSTSGTNQTLSRQVRDLSGRVGYATQSFALLSWVTTQPANTPFGPAVAFDLTEPRVVSAEYTVSTSLSGVASNGQSINLICSTGFLVNGVDPAQAIVSQGFTSLAASWNVSTGFNSRTEITPITAKLFMTLPEGSHTIQGILATRSITFTGSPSGSAQAERPTLFVDVLQPAG